MIHHASLTATHPESAATTLATVLAGEALPFFPEPGAWIVFADDTAIELYPHGTELVHDATTGYRSQMNPNAPRHSGVHFAIYTTRSEPEVTAAATAAGWPARRVTRGRFDVIDVWIEHNTLIEIVTPELIDPLRAAMNPTAWRHALQRRDDGQAPLTTRSPSRMRT